MKVLEPIEKPEIPTTFGRRSDYDEVYQRALSVDGLAVPVEFDTKKEAMNFRWLLGNKKGRGQALGLRGILRGNTVFVFRIDSS